MAKEAGPLRAFGLALASRVQAQARYDLSETVIRDLPASIRLIHTDSVIEIHLAGRVSRQSD